MKPDEKLVNAVFQQLMKMMANQQQGNAGSSGVKKGANFAGIIHASNANSFSERYGKNTWLIDSGAFDPHVW